MGAWFRSTFLASVERRSWLAWIIATSVAGLAIANSAPIGGLVVVPILGVLPGWLVARAGGGTFGPAVQEHTHHVALLRARSPLPTIAILIPAIALSCIAAPAALNFLVGVVADLVGGIVTIVGALLMGLLAVLYVAVMLAVIGGLGVAVVAKLWSGVTSGPKARTTKAKAEAPRARPVEPDLTASFRQEFPPARRP